MSYFDPEQVKTDCDRYHEMLAAWDGNSECLAIEKRYELDGYPPEIVTRWFVAEMANPGSGYDAIDRLLCPEEFEDDAPE